MHSGKGRSRFGALIALGTVGALAALLLVPGGAMAQKKKLKVSVKTSSQAQALNQGALKVSYKSKGLNKLSATATATRSGGGQVKLTQKATKNNPRNGTLSLRLTNAGDAALSECSSLTVRVEAKGKPNKSDNARANLAEDNRECAKPVKEFETETSTSYPTGIDVGPDGALWFAHSGAGQNSLGRMTTAGQYSNFHIPVPEGTPPGRTAGHSINDVVTGPDGAIWATPLGSDLGGAGASVVRRIDPATGAVTEYPLPNGVYLGSRLTVGPDGALWLTSQNPGQLFRITTTGEVTEFALDPGIFPYGIATGGDGGVWFTTPAPYPFVGEAAVGRLDPTSGETQLFPLSDPTKLMGHMTADRAGRLWFTTPFGNTIGRIDPSSGQIVEFEIPTEDSKPVGITFADDGSLWFTENRADNIGRFDPATGTFTEYPLEAVGSGPFDIVEGPDGMIYFTELASGRIGQLDPDKAPLGDPNPSDGKPPTPFSAEGRCEIPTAFLCQQQVNLAGSTFQIGTALTQELPPQTLTLTAGVDLFDPDLLVPPSSGPMLEARPLDVVVGGQRAVTRIGLAGKPVLHNLFPLEVTVPIDLYVSQGVNPQGGCVIGPVVQELVSVEDDEGDLGNPLTGEATQAAAVEDTLGGENALALWTGTLEDTMFEVPEARGCGPLTTVINTLLSLPSPSGANATSLPFSMLLVSGPGFL